MGKLINGTWITDDKIQKSSGGQFVRKDALFRNWITVDGRPGVTGTGGFAAQSGRYHLYVAFACPWAQRTLIFRALKGLKDHISVSALHPLALEHGWRFEKDNRGATVDHLFDAKFIHQIYTRSDASVTSRATVPVLWDKKTNAIVSNESSEIIRMFNSAFDALTGNSLDFWPAALREKIEAINVPIYDKLNNGVYRAGFASNQSAYDKAVQHVFEMLDELEGRLSENRYLLGDRITEADWRLFTTCLRFDLVYYSHFKCALRRLTDYPNLWDYTRELYQWPGVAETVNFDHIVAHYYGSHESINPRRIIPIRADIDWDEPHGRG